jgi:hypothetical protein
LDQVVVETAVEVATKDSDETVKRLLRAGGWMVKTRCRTGICVAKILEERAIGCVVVPDGELKEDTAEEEENLRAVVLC